MIIPPLEDDEWDALFGENHPTSVEFTIGGEEQPFTSYEVEENEQGKALGTQ